MHAFFDISGDDVAQLNDTQLREVIARLCQAEMRRSELSTAHVTWDGDQRASDGGIDVMVSVPSGQAPGGWIPSLKTGIQVKAEDMPASKIAGEMFPRGVVRPAFSELETTGGTYIIASSKASVSDRRLRERRQVMRQAADANGLPSMQVAYYGRQSLADWINEHPGLKPWVRSLVGRPAEGWKSYGAWAYMETDAHSPFLEDPDVKAFGPGDDEGVTAKEIIDRIRGELRQPGKCLRLTGLSGVGKTRLVQALFEGAVGAGEPPLDRDTVLYADEGETVSPQPPQMVEQLNAGKQQMVIIVDNCSAVLHEQLVKQVRSRGSLLSLLTVEYDIRDDLSIETQAYRLEPGSDRLIETLIERRFPHLFTGDVEKIVEFSSGNARVAIALASTAETGGELAQLKHEALFDRLFRQRHDPDANLLGCASAISLVFSFDGVDESNAQSELTVLSELADMTRIKMRKSLNELERRGLLQKRGNWRALLPHAIANRLALRAVEDFPPDILWDKLAAGGGRLARSFSKRLSFLHETQAAVTFANSWLADGMGLDCVERLSDLERDIFCNLAPLAPRRVLEHIEGGLSSEDFISTTNYQRSRFTSLMRNIAHDPDHFDRAVDILAAFTKVENKGYTNEPAREKLQRLFQIQFSGTDSSPEQRAATIKRFLASARPDDQEIGLGLLASALNTEIRRDLSSDFGARRLGPGYFPSSKSEIADWYKTFLDLAVEFGSEKTGIGLRVRKRVGDALSRLWAYPEVWVHLEATAEKFHAVDGWPEGWLGVKGAMYYRSKKLSKDGLQRLRALEKKLHPSSLMAKVRAHVFGVRNLNVLDLDEKAFESDSYTDKIDALYRYSEDLGRQVALDDESFEEGLPLIFQKSCYNTQGAYAAGIGQAYPDPQKLLGRLHAVYEAADKTKVQLYGMGDLIRAVGKREEALMGAFLDNATTDPLWADIFPILQGCFSLDEKALARCISTVERTNGSVLQFGSLSHSLRNLSVPQIERLSEALLKKTGGFSAALRVVFGAMHDMQHSARSRDDTQGMAVNFLAAVPWDHLQKIEETEIHHLVELVKFAFSDGTEIEVASKIASGYARWRENTHSHVWHHHSLLGELFKVFGTRLLDSLLKDGMLSTPQQLLAVLGRSSQYDTPAITALAPTDVLAWCEQEPGERFKMIGSVGEFFVKSNEDDDSGIAEAWTPLGALMLKHAPDKPKFIINLVDRAHPRHGGSKIPDLLRERAKLILALADNPDPEVQAVATNGHAELVADAERWAQFFNDSERQRNVTFE